MRFLVSEISCRGANVWLGLGVGGGIIEGEEVVLDLGVNCVVLWGEGLVWTVGLALGVTDGEAATAVKKKRNKIGLAQRRQTVCNGA
jgi:hypothetical protein